MTSGISNQDINDDTKNFEKLFKMIFLKSQKIILFEQKELFRWHAVNILFGFSFQQHLGHYTLATSYTSKS